MDQITVDITDIPSAGRGSAVTLIGMQVEAVQTAEDLAIQAGTISYDILTGLLPRVPRLYVRDGRVVGAMRLEVGPHLAPGS
jgi:alanine racemase